LLCLSNRMPAVTTSDRRREVGGLVAALEPALRERDGIWLGWSGRELDARPVVAVHEGETPRRASFDLPPRWRRGFYSGFCNRVLWPLMHGFPGRVRMEGQEWHSYREANAAYARMARELVDEHATIWVHDFHLLLVASELRRAGHQGPVGLFLHVPFPPLDLFEILPAARFLIDAMLDFDVIGFQTGRWAGNFIASVRGLLGLECAGGRVAHDRGHTQIDVNPVGVDAAVFAAAAAGDPDPEVAGLRASLGRRRLLLGVDRLDYSKGIPERLHGFESLLERHPEWRGQVSLVQISVPSRADVPEYAELRRQVENLVGRINGQYGGADWVPVRYLYRSYPPAVLAQLYRTADVALVTPLRDGLNLVAKEFVAAQHPERPGVLVLSRFAGAAEELGDAVLTNPYDREGLAADIDRALRMTSDERLRRHAAMLAVVTAGTPAAWADRFVANLQACGARYR
jgi:trehalose 6-phosphate synthase